MLFHHKSRYFHVDITVNLQLDRICEGSILKSLSNNLSVALRITPYLRVYVF
jgi:hypothetical protein